MATRLTRLCTTVALALLMGACDRGMTTEPGAVAPPTELPPGAVLLQCLANVRAGEMRCETAPTPALPEGVRAARVVGGQDRYVQLTSAGTAYDGGTELFSSTVRLQNLTRMYMGTPDGSTVQGVQVFFHQGPTVTSGTGIVTVRNPDGSGVFTGSGQPYFEYAAILAPMEISDGRLWEFDLPSTVNSFVFSVYVSTPLVDESAVLLGPVWTGGAGTSDWFTAGNWDGGAVPDSTAVTTVPSDSLLGGAPHPTLGADASVQHLRVGHASTLDLGGSRLDVHGNVDATGTVTNGTIRLAEEAEFAGGRLPAMEVAGNVALQRPTTATGPISIFGSLHVGDRPLTISLP